MINPVSVPNPAQTWPDVLVHADLAVTVLPFSDGIALPWVADAAVECLSACVPTLSAISECGPSAQSLTAVPHCSS